MNKRITIITLGFLVALMPFLGFPGDVKTIFFVIVGLALAVMGYVLEVECKKCINRKQNIENKENQETTTPVGRSIMSNNT